MSELRIIEVNREATSGEELDCLVQGYAMCAGCEDEIVVAVPGKTVYCEDCKRVDEVLRWLYATRDVKPLEPREHAGVVEMPFSAPAFDLPDRCLAGAKRGQLVAVVAAVLGVFALFCLLGWFGLRAIAALGIWAAQ